MSGKKIGRVYRPKIKIIGIGGGGSSIVNEISKLVAKQKFFRPQKTEFIVANLDLQAINSSYQGIKKFYFGQEITSGLGSGMKPEIGKEAAKKAKEKIKRELARADLCLLISSLGGGTGSGAGPVFAEIAASQKSLNFGIFTLPFKFEGEKRAQIAKEALANLTPHLNAFSIIPNQRIFKIIDNNTPLDLALSFVNKFLAETIIGFLEMLYLPGLINIDFADFKTILKNKGGLAYLNTQEVEGQNREEKAIDLLAKNPLLEYDPFGAEKILFNIAGSKDLKIKEVEKISKAIFALNPKAKIIFGISQSPEYREKIKVTLLAVGCKAEKEKKKIKKAKHHPPKKEKKSPEKKPKAKKRKKRKENVEPQRRKIVRRNALDLHKKSKEEEIEMLEEEKKWDIPAFLRKKIS
jgi:cell division protein FtsZ